MPLTRPRLGTACWVGGLLLTVAVVGWDSDQRLDSIAAVTAAPVSGISPPAPDPDSPTGYVGGQHRLILPAIDGYHWLLQTERMMGGGGLRVRRAEYDDAPAGREVHWSGVMRWWGAGMAVAYRATHPTLTSSQALERVAPWANTLALIVVLVALVPVLAGRLGGPAAGLFAVGTFAVFPFYEYFVVGYFDHHGVATMASAVAVLLLGAGGAGWGKGGYDAAARRWLAASAVLGGTALWVNAATAVPVLIGIGVGALLSVAWLGPSVPADALWRSDPRLWRWWGLVGGAISLAFYLLEYFPAHMDMRLEVNHPFYALAWVGAGDFICRVGERKGSHSPGRRWWLTLDAAAVLLLPAVILATGTRTFLISDPFLFTLHQRYIVEFLPLAGQLLQMTPGEVAGRLSPAPLVILPVAACLWATPIERIGRWGWRAFLVAAVAVGAAFAHLLLRGLIGGQGPLVALADAFVVGLMCAPFLLRGRNAVESRESAVFAVALAPTVLLLAMSMAQVRWVGVAAALALVTIVLAAGLLVPAGSGLAWTRSRRTAAAALLLATLLASPVASSRLPLARTDGPQQLARDAAHWLRRRVDNDPAVVFASPNATTWLTYFGGFPGVGTLYWENLEGLRAAAAIYTAPTADSLRTLLRERGVTHLVLFPWDQGLELLRAARADALGGPQEPAGFLPTLTGTLRGSAEAQPTPGWLVPLPYPPPAIAALGHPSAIILEVVPDQDPEVGLVALARYYQAIRSPDRIESSLSASLGVRPTVPAWALLAQMHAARGEVELFAGALRSLRLAVANTSSLEVGDRVDAAVAFAIGRDGEAAAEQLDRALQEADDRQLRRLSEDQLAFLVRLSRQLGIDRSHGEMVAAAESLLPAAPR